MQYEGALYHVVNRGNYRRDVFESPDAAQAFVSVLEEATLAYGWKCHAYVVMRNHYHILLETPQPNLGEGMHWLQGTLAARFNRFRSEHKRHGEVVIPRKQIAHGSRLPLRHQYPPRLAMLPFFRNRSVLLADVIQKIIPRSSGWPESVGDLLVCGVLGFVREGVLRKRGHRRFHILCCRTAPS